MIWAAGPALEWLAARVRRLTGMDVAAEWDADGRPPGEVELAAFRIAQEAVSNAVRHGRPPIRYSANRASDRPAARGQDAAMVAGSTLALLCGAWTTRRGMLGMGAARRADRRDLGREPREVVGTMVVLQWAAPTG